MVELKLLAFIALMILLVYACYRLAERKGFIPWFWLFSGGFGIILLLILPSAKTEGLTADVIQKRNGVANVLGICFSILILGSIILLTQSQK